MTHVYESSFYVSSFHAVNEAGKTYTADANGFISLDAGDVVRFESYLGTSFISLNKGGSNMNAYEITLLCVIGAIVAVWLVDRFTGGHITEKIIQWHPVLAALTALTSAVSAVLPSSYFATLNVVLKAVCDGTVTAEQLWKMDKLPKEERNDYAKLLIGEKLAAAGIEVTPQIEQVIDGVIAIVCMLMPHESDKDDKLTDGEAEQLNQDLGI